MREDCGRLCSQLFVSASRRWTTERPLMREKQELIPYTSVHEEASSREGEGEGEGGLTISYRRKALLASPHHGNAVPMV